MLSLTGKTMVVIGGSRGVGRRIVEAGVRNGARVLAVARQEGPLRQLAREVPGVEVLSLDATDEGAPSKVFDVLPPDILVLCAGAFPPAAPIHEQTWREFAVNWETDVKIAFHFCKAALSRPLPAGASVVLISSGAASQGRRFREGMPEPSARRCSSRTTVRRNRIVSDAACDSWRSRRESCRKPTSENMRSRAIPAISAYPRPTSFESMASPPTASDVATAVIEWLRTPDRSREKRSWSQGRASKP